MKWTRENRIKYMREYHMLGKTIKGERALQETESEAETRINEEHLKTIFGVEYEDVMI